MIAIVAVLVPVIALGVAALLLTRSHASIAPSSDALAKITMPLGGGRVQSVTATTGPNSRPVPVSFHGGEVWPVGKVPAHEKIEIQAVIARPGWVSWLTGSTARLAVTVTTPSSHLVSPYVTVREGSPIVLRFRQPVAAVEYGTPGHMTRKAIPIPVTTVSIPRPSIAGTMLISAVPKSWETGATRPINWFPGGTSASAVATPAPGSVIKPDTPLTLTFNKPVSKALGSALPKVLPADAGSWHLAGTHTLTFVPTGVGYGIGAHVSVALPSGVLVVGGHPANGAEVASWTVPPGSTLRLHQLLAGLGYLPLDFKPAAPVALTDVAQEAAAVDPPAGSFDWRYANTPAALKSFWSPGTQGIITKGALMAFETDHGLSADGIAGPDVWRALIAATVAGHKSTFGYTFVTVDKSAQRLSLWHSGQTVLTTPVNTGIAQAPTASGTYPVYEHLPVTTMSGTNPDGSKYHDPGIQFVSYFNGGDALHAFTRAQYGFPQSLGCVEMALGPAGQVYPYTPIGTLVHVA